MVALKLGKYGGLGYKAACAPVYNYASSGKSLHKNHRPQSTNMPSCSVGKLYAHPRISLRWGITVRDITLTLWSTQNILTQSYPSWSSNQQTINITLKYQFNNIIHFTSELIAIFIYANHMILMKMLLG